MRHNISTKQKLFAYVLVLIKFQMFAAVHFLITIYFLITSSLVYMLTQLGVLLESAARINWSDDVILHKTTISIKFNWIDNKKRAKREDRESTQDVAEMKMHLHKNQKRLLCDGKNGRGTKKEGIPIASFL